MWSGHIPSVVTSGFQSKSECISTTEVSHGNIPRPCKFSEICCKTCKSHPFSVKKLEAKISIVNIKLMVVLNSNWFWLNFKKSYWMTQKSPISTYLGKFYIINMKPWYGWNLSKDVMNTNGYTENHYYCYQNKPRVDYINSQSALLIWCLNSNTINIVVFVYRDRFFTEKPNVVMFYSRLGSPLPLPWGLRRCVYRVLPPVEVRLGILMATRDVHTTVTAKLLPSSLSSL